MESSRPTLKYKSNRYCSVPQCKSRATSEISLMLYPKDENLKKQWAQVLKIGKEVSKYMYVCSLHFLNSDFVLPDIFTKRRHLKKGAIPSQKLPEIEPNNTQLGKHRIETTNRRNCFKDTSGVRKLIPSTSYDEELNVESLENEEFFVKEELPHEFQESSLREIPLEEDLELQDIIIEDATEQTDENNFDKKNLPILDSINTNEHLNAFTGIPNFKMLNDIVRGVELAESSSQRIKLSVLHRVMLVFIKLKLNLPFECLSVFFQVTKDSCRNYFAMTIHSLRALLVHAIHFPDKEEILANLPTYFIGEYADTRIVLYCKEILIEKFNCSDCVTKSYSTYEDNGSVRIVIGFTPSGMISYVSEAYSDQTSENAMLVQSEVLEKCVSGKDAILVYEALQIQTECDKHKIKLIRLPFFEKRSKSTTPQGSDTPEIVSVQVHIERYIQRLQMFKILKDPICQNMLPYIDDIMIVLAGIINLAQPIQTVPITIIEKRKHLFSMD